MLPIVGSLGQLKGFRLKSALRSGEAMPEVPPGAAGLETSHSHWRAWVAKYKRGVGGHWLQAKLLSEDHYRVEGRRRVQFLKRDFTIFGR